jgi:L-ribulose-5-phosphate 3-epimerase
MARIKLGICQKSLGLPFRRSLPAAHQLGVAGLELEATGELLPQNLTQTGRREITHLLRSHDLGISALMCHLRRGLDDAENLEPRMEQLRQTMALAFELGPRLVIIQAGRIPERAKEGEAPAKSPGVILGSGGAIPSHSNTAADLMRESLESLGKHGDRIGVTLALDTGLDDPNTVAAYLNSFDVGSLAVNFNPANLVISGHNPYDAVKTFHRRIAQVHAEDARRISPNKMATVPLGHGDLDWLALSARFEEIDYRSYFTIPAADRAELAAGVAFLRRFVA